VTAPLGLSLATSSGLPIDELGALAGKAERAGFSTVLLTERVGDVLSACPAALAATEKIAVGTGIANAYLHPPVLTAMTAANLDDSSGGRFLLGLGTANAGLNHGMLGLPRVPPLRLIEEYVATVRAVLAGKPVHGEVFQLPSPLALDLPPRRKELPIYLAALGPRMLELAGRIADGALLTVMSPQQAAAAARTVRDAAERAGRDPAEVSIACVVQCCLSEDPATSLAAARRVVLRFARHASAGRLFAAHDPADEMQAVRQALDAGEHDAAAAAVPQRVADAFVAHGTANDCRTQLKQYRDGGIDLPVLFPMPVHGGWTAAVDDALATFGEMPTHPDTHV
jgi:alkanesulfonate monooxygenase SsuD/methylene tetrahydromethanopterin reductase-like flavin-dependent oxidoreductase (luciferase family)